MSFTISIVCLAVLHLSFHRFWPVLTISIPSSFTPAFESLTLISKLGQVRVSHTLSICSFFLAGWSLHRYLRRRKTCGGLHCADGVVSQGKFFLLFFTRYPNNLDENCMKATRQFMKTRRLICVIFQYEISL